MPIVLLTNARKTISVQESGLLKTSPKHRSIAPIVARPYTGHQVSTNTALTKNKRTKSKKNLRFIKSLPCFICGATPADPDHFRSRGAGGGDDLSNLNALCRTDHIKRHAMGIKTFWSKYSVVILANREKYELPPLDLGPILD